MKLQVLDNQGKKVSEKEMPKQFTEAVRVDLIKRAVNAANANKRQVSGLDPEAGMKVSAKLSRRRRDYRGSYGHGISRVPRKIMSRNGTRMNWTGAEAPGTVGGRRAHGPKASKIITQKINVNERRKAIRSALAATVVKDLVAKRGHILPANYPFIINSDFEDVVKSKDLVSALNTLGLTEELNRVDVKKVRAGKGKLRGRRYKTIRGILVVVSKNCPLLKAGKNIPGVELVEVRKLNAELLAPGSNPGRLTLYTESAVDLLTKENLFSNKSK